MAKTTQNKQVFSISQKYSEIVDILNSTENKSEFICQAIIEKASGMNKVDDDVVLEDKIKKVLKDMMSENIFLVSGSPSNVSTNIPAKKEDISNKKDIIKHKEEKKEISADEDSAYLKNIFNNM